MNKTLCGEKWTVSCGFSFRYPTHTDHGEGKKCYGLDCESHCRLDCESHCSLALWVYSMARNEWYFTFMPNVRFGPFQTRQEAMETALNIRAFKIAGTQPDGEDA